MKKIWILLLGLWMGLILNVMLQRRQSRFEIPLSMNDYNTKPPVTAMSLPVEAYCVRCQDRRPSLQPEAITTSNAGQRSAALIQQAAAAYLRWAASPPILEAAPAHINLMSHITKIIVHGG